MRRGILVLNSSELMELGKVINTEKIGIALENLKEENKILVTDEELEDILDQIGRPLDNDILLSVSRNISEVLLSLRNR
jgi:hypothetical protein